MMPRTRFAENVGIVGCVKPPTLTYIGDVDVDALIKTVHNLVDLWIGVRALPGFERIG